MDEEEDSLYAVDNLELMMRHDVAEGVLWGKHDDADGRNSVQLLLQQVRVLSGKVPSISRSLTYSETAPSQLSFHKTHTQNIPQKSSPVPSSCHPASTPRDLPSPTWTQHTLLPAIQPQKSPQRRPKQARKTTQHQCTSCPPIDILPPLKHSTATSASPPSKHTPNPKPPPLQ